MAAVLFFGGAAWGQTTLFTLSPNGPSEVFGSRVASAGDVDGDGYPDFLIGSGGPTSAFPKGRVQLVSGKNGEVMHSFEGDVTIGIFGTIMAGIGDTNGDGFLDVAVGVPGLFASLSFVRVYSGKDASLLYTIFAPSISNYAFGGALDGLGDANRDGFADFLIGDASDSTAGAGAGAAAIYSGVDGSFLLAAYGTAAGQSFGRTLSRAGDVNHDTYPDFVAGAPAYNGVGYARVCSGLNGSTIGVLLDTVLGPHLFAASVAGVGDIDADGFPDLAVGAPNFPDTPPDFPPTASGALRVYSGRTGGTLQAHAGPIIGDQLGSTVAAAGDLNNDGTPDVLAGAPSDFFLSPSHVYAYSGANGLVLLNIGGGGPPLGVADVGDSIAGAGDVDHDGNADVLIGVSAGTTGRSAYVLSGQSGSPLYSFVPQLQGFGNAVAGGGDLDGDGVSDILVGASQDDVAGLDAGAVRAYSGRTGLGLYTFRGDAAGDYFGWSVADAGDVNGDGFADVLVGAPQKLFTYQTQSSGLRGYARLISGADGAILRSWLGDTLDDEFGYSVASAGDVNLDGFPDVLVGAPRLDHFNNTKKGYARVLSGLSGATLHTFVGGNGDALGCSVSGAGDVDQDGVPDLLVGANQLKTSSFGYATVFSGGTGAVLFQFTPPSLVFNFGSAVAGAGDTNRDGTPDLLVGSQYFNAAGVVRLLSGTDGSLLHQWTGTYPEDLGISLAGLGDVDNDGYADVMIGNKPESVGPSSLARIFSGRDYSELEAISGPFSFGSVLGAIGDFDGDGVPDAVISDPTHQLVYVESLIPTGLSVYGTGTPGCAGSHLLSGSAVPKIDSPAFRLTCNHAPPNALGLGLAASAADLVGSDPFGLGVLLQLNLFASAEILTFDLFTDSAGFGSASAPIPNAPALIGKIYFAQALLSWASGPCAPSPYLLSTSKGLVIPIQP